MRDFVSHVRTSFTAIKASLEQWDDEAEETRPAAEYGVRERRKVVRHPAVRFRAVNQRNVRAAKMCTAFEKALVQPDDAERGHRRTENARCDDGRSCLELHDSVAAPTLPCRSGSRRWCTFDASTPVIEKVRDAWSNATLLSSLPAVTALSSVPVVR